MSKRAILSIILLLLASALIFTSSAWASCSSPGNAIEAENCLTGTPESTWQISGTGDASIQGFGDNISVNVGQTINFKIDTNATSYHLDIYRMGYYQGNGARKVATVTPTVTLPQNQPNCLTNAGTGLYDCGNWAVSASWAVPSNAVSGIYFARVIRDDTGGASHIMFIVRNDASHSNILFQATDTSWQAYNDYGGQNLYGCNGGWNLACRAYKVSYNRPFHTRDFQGESVTWVFGNEYPMVRWLEANGYDVTYFSDTDTDRNGALILNHKLWMSNGHDEYWSGNQRANVEAARNAGVHLAFFSGNTMFWKVRWESSADGTNTPYRTLVCYKETANDVTDPLDPPTWTGTWRDPRHSPPADGGRPENAIKGNIFRMNGGQSSTMTVPAADGKMRFWRNTTVANLSSGSASLAPGTVGAEFDDDEDNGFRPAGLFELTATSVTDSSNYLLDYGVTYGAGTAVNKVVMYRYSSGALVFSTGTYRWSWGLDNHHDDSNQGSTTNLAMQQATVNLFADMGIQPVSLQSGLLLASASTDTIPPTSTITSPTSGASIAPGSQVTVQGTAADTGGGVVAAVEVSTDGGTTWHPASGRASWTYSWTAPGNGTVTIRSRAVDDSGNLETPSAGVTVTVGSGTQTCPCTIWPSSSAPATVDQGPDSSVELGVKFKADTSGLITALRFYKSTANTGTHVGSLWTSSGTLLASATFANETASGWQQVSLSSPVAITAGTVYVASYHTTVGHYSEDDGYFASTGFDNTPLHALQDGVSGANGAYSYGSTSTFPTQAYLSANYWVDVVFTPAGSFSISGTISGAGGSGATVSLSGTSSATVTADASGNYSFTALANGSYTVTPNKAGFAFTPTSQPVTLSGASVSGVNFTAAAAFLVSGNISPAASGSGSTVTLSLGEANLATATADSSGNFIFNNVVNGSYTVTPSKAGFTFTPTSQGVTVNGANVTGVNFTAAAPTWTVSGTITPAANGSGSTVTLSQGSTTIATVTADSGGNFSFSSVVNGTYTLTPSKAGFAFTPASQNVTVNSANVTGASFTAAQTWNISGTISPAASGSGSTVTLTQGSTTITTATADSSGNFTLNNVVNGTYTVTPTKSGFGFTPPSQAVTVNGANVTAVNFTAAQVGPACPCTLWPSSATPVLPDQGADLPVELGLRFKADVNGSITGIRFYKSAANTGTHVANLWNNSGTLLASATFTNETASGWQQVNFSSPVSITAGTVYVASYHTTVGHYAEDNGYFATSGFDNAPLHALQDGVSGVNGAYAYGSSSTYPTQPWLSSNYWVDVVFTPAGSALSSVTLNPTSVSGGSSSNGTVTLTGPAPSQGVAITLSSDNGAATVSPTSLTIPSGSSSGSFTVNTTAVTTSTTAHISASDGKNNAQATLTITPVAHLSSVSVNPTSVVGGNSSTGTVTLDNPAPTGGALVSLTSDNAVAAVPANVTVLAGATSATFSITTSAVASTATANISATYNGVTPTPAALTVNPPALSAVSVNPTSVVGGNPSTGTVTLTGLAPTGGISVTLQSSNTGVATVPGSVTVLANTSSITFQVTTVAVTSSTPVTITATYASVNKTATLTVTPKPLLAIDKTVSTDRSSNGSTIASPAFTTSAGNELLLAFISADAPSSGTNTTVSSIAGGGLTWVLVRRTNAQRGTAEVWRAFAPAVLTNATVTATLSRSTAASITVVTFTGVDTTGTSGSGAIGANASGSAASGAPTASLTTTRNNSWVFGVGTDWDNATARTVPSNQAMVHQYLATIGDTYWVQRQASPTPTSGTVVTINDTAPTGDRYNLTIVEVLPSQ